MTFLFFKSYTVRISKFYRTRKTQVVEITWIYCHGHAGVRGNEEADRLSVSAPLGCQGVHLCMGKLGKYFIWDY
jgi:hypothetical protein